MAKKIAKVKKFKGVDQGRHKKVAKVKASSKRRARRKAKVQKPRGSKLFDENALSDTSGAGLNSRVNLKDLTPVQRDAMVDFRHNLGPEAAPPMGEELDIRQEAVERIPDTRSVFDEGIGNFNPKTAQGGFGVAKKGETGTAAVARIKAEEAAAKKKKKKSKVKKRK